MNLDVLRHAKVLHLDGYMLDAAIYAARKCREYGIRVSHDAGGTYPGVERLMPYVDYLIPSEEFTLKLTGKRTAEEAARALYTAYRPELAALTQGARYGMSTDAECRSFLNDQGAAL